jgi:hypothetical protein
VPEQFLMLLCYDCVTQKRKHFLSGENASGSGLSTQEEICFVGEFVYQISDSS